MAATSVGIIGADTFGRALARRLRRYGYAVDVGTDLPVRDPLCLGDEPEVTVTSVNTAIQRNDVIFVLVGLDKYRELLLPHKSALVGKTLVEVSKQKSARATASNAEYLSSLLPGSKTVKASNPIPACHLDDEYHDGSRTVFIAGDDHESKIKVSAIFLNVGLRPDDVGCLRSARQIESLPEKLFQTWRSTLLFALALFNTFLLYAIIMSYLEFRIYRWQQLFMKVLNKPVAMTAVTLLTCGYIPDILYDFWVISRRNKYGRPPSVLDKWLKAKGQLKTISVVMVFMHVCITITLMSPTYYPSLFEDPVFKNISIRGQYVTVVSNEWMTWQGEVILLLGLTGFLLLLVSFGTSLPGVADKMTWREWRFADVTLGFIVLALAVAHVITMAVVDWNHCKGNMDRIVHIACFPIVILPSVTLVCRLVLKLTCLDKYLRDIQNGFSDSATRPGRSGFSASTEEVHMLTTGYACERCSAVAEAGNT